MSLQFIMGNSGAGKSRYVYEKILAEAARHPEKNYLIVVPEQFTMQTQKELVSLHPAGGILNIDILSFQRLAYRIFEETGGSLYPVLEETGKSLVVKRVAQEKKKELTILGSTLGTCTVANSSSFAAAERLNRCFFNTLLFSLRDTSAPRFRDLLRINGKGLEESTAIGVNTGYTLS